MRYRAVGLACIALTLTAFAPDKVRQIGDLPSRENIHEITLPDGTWLSMQARIYDEIEKPQEVTVRIVLYPKDAVALSSVTFGGPNSPPSTLCCRRNGAML